jgi:hypothetical protein
MRILFVALLTLMPPREPTVEQFRASVSHRLQLELGLSSRAYVSPPPVE